MRNGLVAALTALAAGLAAAPARGDGGAARAFAWDGRVLTVRTDRYEATFELGCLTSLTNRLTGEVYARRPADFPARAAKLAVGLGARPAELSDADRKLLARVHAWEGPYGRHVERLGGHPFACRPDANSTATFERPGPAKARVTWRDLACAHPAGRRPGASFALDLAVLPDSGELAIDAVATAAAPQAFAASVAFANISPELEVIVPLFQGCSFRPADEPAFRKVAHWPSPYVASLAVLAGAKGAAAFWMADANLGDRYVHLHNAPEAFDLMFEGVNQAPLAGRRVARSRPIRLNVVRGSWVRAARPYRDWWQRTFRVGRLAGRRPAWLKDIRWFSSFGRHLPPAKLAPRCVYFCPQSWKVQPKIGDGGLFPYAIEAGPRLNRLTKEMLADLRARGAHPLVYMNINHMNEGHPWAPRFWPHRVVAPFGDAPADRQPEPRSPKTFLVHTAHRPWQDLQVRWAKRIDERFGIKGYYMDCARGLANHAGGRVRGLNDCQGQIELMRRLRGSIPEAFLNAEFATEVTAAATDFAFLGFDAWFGGEKAAGGEGGFRGWRWRERHCHPIVGFLFNPYIRITTHRRGFASDAFDEVLGRLPNRNIGPAGEGAVTDYAQTQSFPEYLIRLLCRTGLTPHYPEAWDRGVRAYYRHPDGGVWRVEADSAAEGRMTRPDADADGRRELVYWRIRGRRTAELPANMGVEGWVAYDDAGAIGLDPARAYYCFGRPRIADWRITRLPPGAVVASCRPYRKGALVVHLARADGAEPGRGAIEVETTFELTHAVAAGGAVALTPRGRRDGRNVYRAEVPAPGAFAVLAGKPRDVPAGKPGETLLDLSRRRPRFAAYLTPSGVRETIPAKRGPHSHAGRRYLATLPNHEHPAVFDFFLDLPPVPRGRRLVLRFTSTTPDWKNNGYTLRVFANGRRLLEEPRPGGTGPRDHEVDLTAFAGDAALLTLEVANRMLFTWVRLERPELRLR